MSIKKLKKLFLMEFIITSKINHVLINEILPEKFIKLKINDTIKEIFFYLDQNLSKKLFDIERFLCKLEYFPKIKITEKIGKLRLKINPIFRFFSSEFNEYYWGEWNLSYQKHGFGIKLISNERLLLYS